MLKRVLHFYWRFSRGLTLGVQGCVLDGDGRVFLVRHGYVAGWHFPGGGVETGEALLQALGRELMEEGNINLKGTPTLHGIFQNIATSRRDHVALFVVREFEWSGPAAPTYEIREAGFFPLNDLPADTAPGTRRRLDEILSGAAAATVW